MREFNPELTKREYELCKQLMHDTVQNPNKQTVFTSYSHLACVLQTYSKLTLENNIADWYNYLNSATTIDIDTLERVPFKYSSFESLKDSKDKHDRDEYSLYHTQCALLYNMYRNEIGDCKKLRDYTSMFYSIRNRLAHEPSALLNESTIHKIAIDKFPSPDFVEALTNYVLESSIGYDYMAEVIKFFKGAYPKGYYKDRNKKKEITGKFNEKLSWNESEFEIRK